MEMPAGYHFDLSSHHRHKHHQWSQENLRKQWQEKNNSVSLEYRVGCKIVDNMMWNRGRSCALIYSTLITYGASFNSRRELG